MNRNTLSGTLLNEHYKLTLNELCMASTSSSDLIIKLVDYGILEPIGNEQRTWRFSASSVEKAASAARLQRDLDLNPAGAAFALDLLDEIKALRKNPHSFH